MTPNSLFNDALVRSLEFRFFLKIREISRAGRGLLCQLAVPPNKIEQGLPFAKVSLFTRRDMFDVAPPFCRAVVRLLTPDAQDKEVRLARVLQLIHGILPISLVLSPRNAGGFPLLDTSSLAKGASQKRY
jgi:hypothetical protein